MTDTVLAEAQASLARIQSFDANTLARKDALGPEMNFQEAVPSAERITGLFKQIPLNVLPEFPDNRLEIIRTNADSTYSLFENIIQFDPKANDYSARTTLINSLKSQH